MMLLVAKTSIGRSKLSKKQATLVGFGKAFSSVTASSIVRGEPLTPAGGRQALAPAAPAVPAVPVAVPAVPAVPAAPAVPAVAPAVPPAVPATSSDGGAALQADKTRTLVSSRW